MIRLLIAALLVPGAALAEPWHGIWSADLAWCENADRIGSVTPAPIQLSETEMLGYENSCDIISAEPVADLNAWTIDMTCFAEGDYYEERHLIMVKADKMWLWYGVDGPIPFERCPQ